MGEPERLVDYVLVCGLEPEHEQSLFAGDKTDIGFVCPIVDVTIVKPSLGDSVC